MEHWTPCPHWHGWASSQLAAFLDPIFLGYELGLSQLWKILKEMGILDHLTCHLRNLYAGQDTTVRTGHGTTDWFQLGKGVHQGCILLMMQSTSWEMMGWKRHKLESRLPGEIWVTSDMQMTLPLCRKWSTKEPLDESEREEGKSWLKAQHSEN